MGLREGGRSEWPMRREVLRASGVAAGYVEPVVKEANISVEEGEIAAVVGPTGSGKTTLLLTLAGLLRPWRGEVLFMGRPLWDQLPEARRHIGVMFQNPDDMFFNSTVRDEIAYTAVRAHGPEKGLEMALNVAEALGLKPLLDKQPYKLSGGQKRLVALAAAVAHMPKLLILDEPTTYLDEGASERALAFIRALRDGGAAVIIATHDLELVCRIADRVYELRDGVLLPSSKRSRRNLCICS